MLKNVIKKIIPSRACARGLFNPFIGMQISLLGDYVGINQVTRETPLIISLSSDRENFKDLPITLYSLINQNLKPDKIVLWLDEDYEDMVNLPYEISQFVKNGLEIRFVKYKGKYTKTYYAFKEFKNSIVVTVDDNIYYPHNWLKKMYLSYISHPEDIHVHDAGRVVLGEDSLKVVNRGGSLKSSFGNFLDTKSGILYPPNCFSDEVLREDIYTKISADSDSVWYWVMALVHNHKIRIVKNNLKTVVYSNTFKYIFDNLFRRNINKTNFDDDLEYLMKFYRSNVFKNLYKN